MSILENDDNRLSAEAFIESLTPGKMLTFRVIAAVLMMGTLLFFFLILMMRYQYSPVKLSSASKNISILQILSMVHAVMAVGIVMASLIIYPLIVSKKNLSNLNLACTAAPDEQPLTPEARCGSLIFTGYIIRAAMFEGIAIFGMIICVIGTLNGLLRQYPVYWLNLLSLVIFQLYMILTFPTRRRLTVTFRRRFMESSRFGVME